jgi:hypothetical protein
MYMKRSVTYAVLFLIASLVFSSCKEFLNPQQEIDLTEDQLYKDWAEYRSVEMGCMDCSNNWLNS